MRTGCSPLASFSAFFAGWSVLRQFTEDATRKALVRMFAFFAALAAIILAAGGQTDLAVLLGVAAFITGAPELQAQFTRLGKKGSLGIKK